MATKRSLSDDIHEIKIRRTVLKIFIFQCQNCQTMLEFFWYILIYSLEGFVVSNTSTENFLKDIKFYSFFDEFNFVILTNHIKKQRDWWLSKELFMKKKNEKRNTINDYRHVLSCLLFLLGRTILT